MSLPLLLFANRWLSISLSELAGRASDWGYDGFEIVAGSDHLEIQRALNESDYTNGIRESLDRVETSRLVVSAHRTSTAVCDMIDSRHQSILPDYVWGDGETIGVRQRASQEMISTFRIAAKLGSTLVSGFMGSPIWGAMAGSYPQANKAFIENGFKQVVDGWKPILDVARDLGVRFAFEVHPGQIAFDYYTTEMLLDRMSSREEFGLTLDPSHLAWLGVDPVEFIRRFADRIFHVHIKDTQIGLSGKPSILNGYFGYDDPRRGWQFRAPGHGTIDWGSFFRELNRVGYSGALSVEFSDPIMDPDYGAAEACSFLRRANFPIAHKG
jgi:sugar phosphate isomerase/epimerase